MYWVCGALRAASPALLSLSFAAMWPPPLPKACRSATNIPAHACLYALLDMRPGRLCAAMRGYAWLCAQDGAWLGVQSGLLLGGWKCPGSAGAALLPKHEAQLLRRF